MKNTMKKLLCVLLALMMVASLAACGEKAGEVQEAAEDVPVNIMVLNGTTGFGMAGLIHDAKEGTTEQEYNISVETDASNIMAALINESVDIAALPTNAASVIYNKTEGAVQTLALNTEGVLYLVSNGSVKLMDFVSLIEHNIYAPAQNPSFILEYLCKANGLVPGENIFIDNTFAQPAELLGAVVSGQAPLAVLPEPMVTAAVSENAEIRIEMDLTEQWNMVAPEGSLVQGCVVVRKDFAREHPQQVETFLKEYEASVALCSEDTATAAAYIAEAGILANQTYAETAMPYCNICFVTGEEMKTRLSAYLELMAGVNPESIGGTLPAEDFYYIP
ncbi:MAG: ABC transporter substrate-binding protein [Ruminococcaceae bacterium]|nr:ABC transporter substrate-binding protein [Oscillospiraceae bacterium]